MSNREQALISTLHSIGALAARVAPKASATLRPGASSKDLGRLAALFGGRAPADLAAWFTWHDGQEDVFAPGMDPDAPAMTWMRIADALAERRSLLRAPEKMLPWDDAWLPIATNGGGDSYVYVMTGPKAGQILFYLHDARRRRVVAKSLAELASRLEKRLAVRDQPRATIRFGAAVEPIMPVGAPSLEDLKAAPVGTFFYRRSLPYRSYWYRLFVKVTKSQWAMARSRERNPRDNDFRIDAAVAGLNAALKEPVVGWKVTAGDIVRAMSDEQIWPDGLFALKGKDPRKDPYFQRRSSRLSIK